MRQDLLHKHLLEPVSNNHDDAIVIATHIKDRVGWHVVGRVEEFTNMIEVPELDVLQYRVPLAQNVLSLWVLLPEGAKHFDGDDVHGVSISNRYIAATSNCALPRTVYRNQQSALTGQEPAASLTC